jgi:toxin FitB
MAASLLEHRFPAPALSLAESDCEAMLTTFARADVAGGATYDGLVALEAKAHRLTLLTLDRRAQETYRRLGAPFEVIGPR